MKLITYLLFDGEATMAMKYYQKILNGKIAHLETYGDVSDDVELKGKSEYLIHGWLECDGFEIYFSDSFKEVTLGDNVGLSLHFTDERKINIIYDKLVKDAKKVNVKLGDSFWNSKYACVKDKFGIIWHLNYQY